MVWAAIVMSGKRKEEDGEAPEPPATAILAGYIAAVPFRNKTE